MQHRSNDRSNDRSAFQSSSTDHSGCNPPLRFIFAVTAGFNPHPLITVDATTFITEVDRASGGFNPHPLITVDATWHKSSNDRNPKRFNPHPLITVDATALLISFHNFYSVSILIH